LRTLHVNKPASQTRDIFGHYTLARDLFLARCCLSSGLVSWYCSQDGGGYTDPRLKSTDGSSRYTLVHIAPYSLSSYINPRRWSLTNTPGVRLQYLEYYTLPSHPYNPSARQAITSTHHTTSPCSNHPPSGLPRPHSIQWTPIVANPGSGH
jgi:hypothetical protein